MSCALLFLAHLAFGAARREVALGFAAAQGLLLATIVFTCPWSRRDLASGHGIRWPAACFAVVLLVGLWSLTPFAPGGPHPIWSYIQATPASTVDKSAVVVELVRLLALGCMFLTALAIGADDDRARWFLRLLVIASGLFAIWAFVSYLVDPGMLFGSIPLPLTSGRLSAAFLSANTAGTFFGISVVISVCAVIDQSRIRGTGASLLSGRVLQQSALSLVAVCFSAACLILTASRGAFVATSTALAVFFVWEALARRWKLFGPAGLGLVALLGILLALVAIGGSPLIGRLLNASGDVAARREITLAHWNAFLASPWMGYGLGSFDAINRMVTTSQNYPQLWNIHAAHDVYLQWLEEAGVFGAAAMFLCIGLTLTLIARGAGRRTRMTTWIRGLVAASLVPLIHGLSDFAIQEPSIAALLACLLGLGLGLAQRPQNARRTGRLRVAAPWIVGALGVVIAGPALAYAVEFALVPTTSPVSFVPLPAAYDAVATQVLDSDPVRARALSLKALMIRPVDARAWLNLAVLDARGVGRLSSSSLLALQRTYDVAPYDPQLISDRVAFAYDHWSELPVDIREETQSEMRVAWQLQTQKDQLMAAMAKVRNPSGKFALAIEMFHLRVMDNLAESEAKKDQAGP